jgi:hypothetical protein
MRSPVLRSLARVGALLRYGAAPLLPPGSRLRADPSAVAQLRRLAREDLDGAGAPAPVARLGASLLWPGLVLARALGNVRRHGAEVARATGISRARQLREALELAWRHDLVPPSYYEYRLFRAENRARAARFIQRHELRALLRRLNAGLDWSRLDDKRAFHAHCLAHGLPAPRLVLACEGAAASWSVPAERLPPVDLVLKPCLRRGGVGLERWSRDEARGEWERRGERLDERALLQRAQRLGQERGGLLVQERVLLHPALADLSPGGTLCTARVVTWRTRDGESGLVEAFLRMPARAEAAVDNWHMGGIGALIDLERGVLGRSFRGPRAIERHPVSGATIAGHPVPCFQELAPLCRRAHATVPGFGFVGWDVGLGRDGPVLIEANSIWGCPEEPPLGETEFPRVALAWLREGSARGGG